MEYAPVVDQRPASVHPTNYFPMVPGGGRPQIMHQHFGTHSWVQNAGFVQQNDMMPSIPSLEKGKHSPATEDGSLQWKAKKGVNYAVELATVRKKIEKVRQELTELQQEDNSAALDKTILLNQNESDEATEGCQQKFSELPREVSERRWNLPSKSEEAKMNLGKMHRKTDQELNKVSSVKCVTVTGTFRMNVETLENLEEGDLEDTVEHVVKPLASTSRWFTTYLIAKVSCHFKNEVCLVTPKLRQKCTPSRPAFSSKWTSFKRRMTFVILLSSLLASSCASNQVECLEEQYAPLMGRAVLRCDGLGDFPLIYWFNDVEDDATAFIKKENGEVTGSGYRAGDYNIDNEGSLVIYNVTIRDDRTFRVRALDSDLIESSDDVTLIVYVEPAEPLPEIRECSGQSTCILKGESDRVISCIHGQSRPAMEVSWFLRDGREDRLLDATVNQMVSADAVTFTTSAQLAMPIDAKMNQLVVLVCKSVQAIPGMKDTERKILLDNSVDDPFTNVENLDSEYAFEREEDFKIKCQSEIDTANNVVLWMYKALNSEDVEYILYSAYGEVEFTTKGEAGFNITDDGALVIKEVDRQLEGYYACVSSLATTFVKKLEVIVLPKPPRIVVQGCEPFQTCHLSVQEAEAITCTVNGVRPLVDLSIVTYSMNAAVTYTVVSSHKKDGLFYTTVEGHVDVSKVICEENHVTVICQAQGTAAYGFMSDATIMISVDGDDCAETSTVMVDPDGNGSGNSLQVLVLLITCQVVVVVLITISVCMIWHLKMARGLRAHDEITCQRTDKFSNGEQVSCFLPVPGGSEGESESQQHQKVAGEIEDRSGL